MPNWFMELNSLKNLICCAKGSWFKSPTLPAGRLSPSELWSASSGLSCNLATVKQAGSPLEGMGLLGGTEAAMVSQTSYSGLVNQSERLLKAAAVWASLSTPSLTLGTRKLETHKQWKWWVCYVMPLFLHYLGLVVVCYCLIFIFFLLLLISPVIKIPLSDRI